jgi:uncharacterized protein
MPVRVLPFRQFVLKVHSRCDLACDHCYVYEHADQSWRGKPKVIAAETVAQAGVRIAEHARGHSLSGVRIVLHGGEPLLAGASRLAQIARALRAAVEPACPLDLRIHTNGIRLDERLCEVFLAERVKVGISLDGDKAANDLHRRFADGRSSYDHVLRAVGLLRGDRYREIFAGLLATIDVRSDPVASYRALAALGPPALEFLLPHGTHDAPPPGAAPGGTPYADWLAAVYEAWHADGEPVPVRIFESIRRTSLGLSSLTEALGTEASDIAVIETDGTIEQADSIKVAYDGAPETGLDIFRHPLDDAAAHPAIAARQRGVAGLSAACRRCPVVASCGGGLYAHRYRTGTGFDNPSVYCADLEKIITHVRSGLGTAPAAGNGPATSEQAASEQAASLPAASERPAYLLPAGDFDALAAGFGDGAAIGRLATAQRTFRRELLELLRARASEHADGAFLAGWELLERLQQDNDPALAAVLAHPYVRAWAERCLRAATRPDGGPAPLPPEAGHLAAIAAAVAVRAGALAEIDVPVVGGFLALPTLGRLRVGPPIGSTGAGTISVADGGFEARANSGKWHVRLDDPAADADWEPVRALRSGDFAVWLEDTDPYRDCHQWPAAPRLRDAEFAQWQEQFAVAWPLIEQDYPAYAGGLAAGLTVLLPLANDMPGREISASARPAFGAVGAALPAGGATLALLLIHEFQHVKLGGLLDMYDLCDPADRRLYYAPWRDDPRPLEPLLQGAYAHLGVTDYWRVRRGRVAGDAAADADERFARWRMLTAEAIETLASSGSLTELGGRFVAGMRATVEPWLTEPVSDGAARAAAQWAAGNKEAWQRREGA